MTCKVDLSNTTLFSLFYLLHIFNATSYSFSLILNSELLPSISDDFQSLHRGIITCDVYLSIAFIVTVCVC